MTIEHPAPKISTIKQLYAHAFTCGFPGCSELLYKVDPKTSQPHLNSRICHINARREKGPRWDGNQTPAENRGRGNLILMCEPHSSLIDDPASVDSYGAELLREWKTVQLEEYAKVQAGWALGNQAAETVRDIEKSGTTISISGSHLDLGGRGGSAPGAGGGGGAAIGTNAKGGDGGKGGNMHVDNGPFTLPFSGPIDFPDLASSIAGDPSPGSGGGGAGALGVNALAGDGGDGGDLMVGSIDIQALEAAGFNGNIEIEVGEGGKPGLLPGELASDGGASLLRFRHHDGTVLRELKVKGVDLH